MTGEFNEESLRLTYKTNDEGVRRLVEHPVCGGIDVGRPYGQTVAAGDRLHGSGAEDRPEPGHERLQGVGCTGRRNS